jgi:hypothetical protein
MGGFKLFPVVSYNWCLRGCVALGAAQRSEGRGAGLLGELLSFGRRGCFSATNLGT